MYSHFSADRPLITQEEDSLGRIRFGESLARVLRGRPNLDSYVVALYGPWGSGKTSLKNMALENLRSDAATCPLIVEFEPWLWNDVAQLTQAFFDEIGVALKTQAAPDDEGKKQKEEANQRRARKWQRYGALFTSAGMVAKAASIFQIAQGQGVEAAGLTAVAGQFDEAAKAAQYAQESLKTDQQDPPLSLFEMRKELADSLRELDQPVLVVMDDIDRLGAKEIATLFQLIKSNANFPNLIYLLLFQRDVVERGLETSTTVAPGAGRDFLGKIVQASFDMPVINQTALKRIFAQSLEQVYTDLGVNTDEYERRFRALLLHILPFIESVRDIRRYCNALAFQLDVLRDPEDGTLEVNPADLAALEALRVFEPKVYELIAGNKLALTTERASPGDSRSSQNVEQEKAAKQLIANLLQLTSEPNRENVKALVGALFPQILWITRDSANYYNLVPHGEALMTLQVCHQAIFDRYFQMAIDARDISQGEWKRLLAATGDRDRCVAHLQDLQERDLLDVALGRLTVWAEKIPVENADSFLTALFDVGDEFPAIAAAPGFAFWGQELQARALLQRYFRQHVPLYRSENDEEMNERRAQFIQPFTEAIKATKGCFFPVYLLYYEGRNSEKLEEKDFLLNESDAMELRAEALRIIRRAAADGSLLALKARMLFVFGCWREWAGDEAKTWLDEVLSTGEGIAAFLRHCVHDGYQWTEDQGGAYQAVDLRTVQSYLPFLEVEARIEQINVAALPSAEQEAVAMFRDAMDRWRRGTLSPLQTDELPDPHAVTSETSSENEA